jgi:4-carboxymuconolactone decarboxylase
LPAIPASLDERQRALHDRIKAGPRGTVRGPLALFLYSPELGERAEALGEFVRFRSAFPPHLSEFMILVVARHLDCDYEWSIHAPIAKAAGVSLAVVEAIGAGMTPTFDNNDQELIYRFVVSLLKKHRVDDDSFEAFRSRFGERGIVDASCLMGYYGMVAHLLNAVRADPLGDPLPVRSETGI